MALKSTIYKAELNVSNMDTHYYQQHQLTLAKHPSETEERLMVRLFAFALYADENLIFGKGVSEEQEPALWRKSLTGEIDLWIDVGLPDERRLRKACSIAKQVAVITYGKRSTEMWWEANSAELKKKKNLTVIQLSVENSQDLSALAARNMLFNCTIEAGEVSLMSEVSSAVITPIVLYQAKL